MSIRSWLKPFPSSSATAKALQPALPALSKTPQAATPDDPSADYAVRTDWASLEGEINFSSFVYFDVDRDGCYGQSDRPFSAIKVRLKKDGKVISSARTNNNGFANFKSSATDFEAPIHTPGVYEFVVSVPSSFTVTSGNPTQSAEFKSRPGSISAIGSDEMLQPVGLAPDRVISGSLPPNARLSVKALSGDIVVDELEYSTHTAFRYAVPAGTDVVEFATSNVKRRVPVSGYPVDLGLLDPKRRAREPDRGAETINFDGVTSRHLRKIPSGYAGLSWFNLNAIARDFTKGSQGYVNGNTSGDYVAYTSSGYPALIYSDTPFNFIGCHLSVAWLKAEGETGIIEAWRGDELIAKDSVTLSALTPVFYNPGLRGITRIRLTTQHYWQMVLDDLIIAR